MNADPRTFHAGETIATIATLLMSVELEHFESFLQNADHLRFMQGKLDPSAIIKGPETASARLGVETARKVVELRRWMEQATKGMIAPLGTR